MSAEAPQIDILYKLFIDRGSRKYDPIDTPAQRALEAALRAADPYKRIDAVADPTEQSRLLHQHVEATFYDFVFDGCSVSLANPEDSRWDPITKTWVEVGLGASLVYAIRSPGGTPSLCLSAWTKGTAIAELETAAGA